MKITKREIFISLAIIFIMLGLGFIIANLIEQSILEDNALYQTALPIDHDPDMFIHARETNVGRTIVHGYFKAVDPIYHPEIGKNVLSYTQHKQRYTKYKHTRDIKDKNGKKIDEEVYYTYSWDGCGSYSESVNEIEFEKNIFSKNIFSISQPNRSSGYFGSTGEIVGNVRWYYTYRLPEFEGLIFPFLGVDMNISTYSGDGKIEIRENITIQEFMQELEGRTGGATILFWIFWIVLIGGLLFGFYTLENEWLH